MSGGGGWGAKKGLLSLDPQRAHFSLSEEEEMQNFIQSMNGGGFTPPGSEIQFFMSAPALPENTTEPYTPGVVFGVAGDVAVPKEAESMDGFIGQHFGALSNSAVYLSGQGLPGGKETKLSVPHSRVYGREPEAKTSAFGNLVYELADAGTIALAGLKH